MRARLIKPDGTHEPLTFPPDGGWELLCQLVETGAPVCLVLVPLQPGNPGVAMWYDAEALDRPRNMLAARLADYLARAPVPEYIAGNVVLTGAPGAIDRTHPLTGGVDDVLAEILDRWLNIEQAEKVTANAGAPMFASMDARS